jgi:hypothetical protein
VNFARFLPNFGLVRLNFGLLTLRKTLAEHLGLAQHRGDPILPAYTPLRPLFGTRRQRSRHFHGPACGLGVTLDRFL